MNGGPAAYSTLPLALARKNTTVAELHRRLAKRGFKAEIKSLYRLTRTTPLQQVNLPMLGAVCQELEMDLDELVSWEKPRPKLHRLDPDTQSKLDGLLKRNAEGTLTAVQRRELEKLAKLVERLSLENARLVAQATAGSRNAARRRTV